MFEEGNNPQNFPQIQTLLLNVAPMKEGGFEGRHLELKVHTGTEQGKSVSCVLLTPIVGSFAYCYIWGIPE